MTDPTAPQSNPYASNPYGTPSGSPKTPIMSIISMATGVLGILSGIFGIGIVFAIAAVILGHLGQRREPEAKGFWLTGLITGYIGVVINLLVIVLAIVFAGFLFATVPTYY